MAISLAKKLSKLRLPVPVNMGGTGSDTQAGARLGLGLKSAAVADVVGTVSQSGGLSTGAIIEKGGGPNGIYTKYADGTMICSVTMNVTDQSISDAYTTLFQGTRSWVFPAQFSQSPAVSCGSFKWGSSASWSGLAGEPSISSCQLRGWDVASRPTGTNCYISAIAIGRWY